MIRTLLMLAGTYWAVTSLAETSERQEYFKAAREYCDEVSKPMLQVGIRHWLLNPPESEVTLDIDERVLEVPGGVVGDERDMPFTNKQFGVCMNSHTLEHLYNAEDIEKAISECVRVADYAVLLVPTPYGIGSLLHPDHKLNILFKDDNIYIKKKWYVEGWKWPGGIGQAMVLHDEKPKVFA